MKWMSFAALAAFVSAVSIGAPARYLIAGGGFYAGHSEVVLEKNVELFRETASWFHIPGGNLFALFAAGNDTAVNDISEIDASVSNEELLFSHLFADAGRPELILRHNHLPGLLGGSNGPELTAQIKQAAGATSVTTPFRFYYTGHGAPTQSLLAPPVTAKPGVIVPIASVPDSAMVRYRDNYMALWNNTRMTAADYTKLLDGFSADTNIQTVMVQCYSGGFAQMMFEKGDPSGNLTKANRCGFFATVPSRVAAGCSADINKREEYSPYFLAAVRGKTEKGATVSADFDGNGTVTSDEAHAFVILNENAIDVPISTSSQMLREKVESIPVAAAVYDWKWYETRMNQIEKAVAEGLAHELGLDLTTASPSPLLAVRTKINEVATEWGESKNASTKVARELNALLTPIYKDIAKAHPVFQDSYPSRDEKDPAILKAVADARKDFQSQKGYLKAYGAYVDLLKSYDDATAVQHRMVKWERLGYLLETKVLEAALKTQKGSEALVEKYNQLRTCEHQTYFQ